MVLSVRLLKNCTTWQVQRNWIINSSTRNLKLQISIYLLPLTWPYYIILSLCLSLPLLLAENRPNSVHNTRTYFCEDITTGSNNRGSFLSAKILLSNRHKNPIIGRHTFAGNLKALQNFNSQNAYQGLFVAI
jgi:hypothetical protein